jgi:hypothetical protein
MLTSLIFRVGKDKSCVLFFQWAYSVSVGNIRIEKNDVMVFGRVNWGSRREAFHSARFSVTDFT